MLSNPTHWQPYYHGNESELSLARKYSYSDRCRYYWPDVHVQRELSLLVANLTQSPAPLTLLSQYMPQEYDAVRDGRIGNRPSELIYERIQKVARTYEAACAVQ